MYHFLDARDSFRDAQFDMTGRVVHTFQKFVAKDASGRLVSIVLRGNETLHYEVFVQYIEGHGMGPLWWELLDGSMFFDIAAQKANRHWRKFHASLVD